jgi:hypothetical protein
MDTTTTTIYGKASFPAWEKLRGAARKDPKKAGFLLILVAVMAGMWGKALIHSQPAGAAAATIREAVATESAGANTSSPVIMSVVSDKLRGHQAGRASWSAIKLMPPSRNLFQVDYDRYPQSGKSTTPGAAVKQQSGDSSGDTAKSVATPADLKKERQILATNLQAQAAGLKLQTTVMGAQPKALVNGSLVKEGDTIASFRIVKITARGMVIERDGIKLEVEMKQ